MKGKIVILSYFTELTQPPNIGLKVRQRFSAWHVRSILWSLFSRAEASISHPFHREFTTVMCWKPLLEPCSQARDRFCSTFGSSAHVSGQKLLTFHVIYQGHSEVIIVKSRFRRNYEIGRNRVSASEASERAQSNLPFSLPHQ